MKAMLIKKITDLTKDRTPLELADVPKPEPGEGQVLVKVTRCGVCHTELDEIEGRTPPARLPMIPGHQVVGRVEGNGPGAGKYKEGDRVGIGWINSSCGRCRFCREGLENLCPDFRATGRDADGGYAGYMVVGQEYAYPIPEAFSDSEAAPLLCAGAVGYRALMLSNARDGEPVGLTGFGASGHLVLAMVRHRYPASKVFVFTRTKAEQDYARELGAAWAGDTAQEPPEKCRAIIDTTPAWRPVVEALKAVGPGGRLVVNAIRKEDRDKDALLSIDYTRDLWMEKEIKSVANVTRRDLSEFLPFAAEIPIKPGVTEYPLEEANRALLEMKERKIRGAKVLRVG
jgi:propanol-preferring alcohol dehydrogenase